MAIKVINNANDSSVGRVVMSWLAHQGIDPGLVTGWRITQRVNDVSTIELTMHFDDTPPAGSIERESATFPRRHPTCIEVTSMPGLPKEYVCGEGCPDTGAEG